MCEDPSPKLTAPLASPLGLGNDRAPPFVEMLATVDRRKSRI
jgi:hypothetical protein